MHHVRLPLVEHGAEHLLDAPVHEALREDLLLVALVVQEEDGHVARAALALERVARLVALALGVHDGDLDAALLEVYTDEALPNGAELATRKQLADTRIFDRIYAVGCPLGNDPIPTPGEIATCRHRVEGELYWMINAPTYIGNSGGGIFDAETHELLGIFSKIYTHGSMRSTIVPHMGLATPIETVYDWLEENGFAHLVRGDVGVALESASAK